jgi:hypothetical protein
VPGSGQDTGSEMARREEKAGYLTYGLIPDYKFHESSLSILLLLLSNIWCFRRVLVKKEGGEQYALAQYAFLCARLTTRDFLI